MGTSSFFEYPAPDEEQPPDELVFMSGQSEAHWRAIFAPAQPQRFRAGDVLIRRGEVERAIYIVIAGALEVVSVEGGASGARVIPVPTGSVIGEIGFFDARPRSATVRGGDGRRGPQTRPRRLRGARGQRSGARPDAALRAGTHPRGAPPPDQRDHPLPAP